MPSWEKVLRMGTWRPMHVVRQFIAGLPIRSQYLGPPERGTVHRVKYDWEIIADNLSKAGWSWAVSQPSIRMGERSGLWTRMATGSVSSCASMKS